MKQINSSKSYNNKMRNKTPTNTHKWFFTLAALFVLSVTVYAATVISDTQITTPIVNTILYVEAGNAGDIQAKINQANNGDKIILPDGFYNIENTIVINKSITFEGTTQPSFRVSPSTTGTVINATASMANLNMINVTVTGVTLRDFGVTGNSITNDGIALVGNTGSFFGENLYMELQGRNGLFALTSIGAGNSLFHIASRENGLHGMEIQRNDFRITDYYAHRNWNGSALMLNNAGGIQVNLMHVFFNNHSLYLNGTDNGIFTNIILESTNTSAIVFDSTHSSINRISIIGSDFFLNDLNNEGFAEIEFLGSANSIQDVTIEGMFDGTNDIFNTVGNSYKRLRFKTVLTELTSLGDYPENMSITNVDNDGNYVFSDGGVKIYNTNSGEEKFTIDRTMSGNEKLEVYIDDLDVIFKSEQDEDTGDKGGFRFIMDDDGTASPNYLIEEKGGEDIVNFNNQTGMTLGDGTDQMNITLTSPDGTEFNCGVSNAGAYECT